MFRQMRALIIAIIVMASGAGAMSIVSWPTANNNDLAQAIQRAAAGDTILVKSGVHHTGGLEISKALTLIGEKGAVLDGSDRGTIITVRADHVTISGLTLRNTPVSFMNDNAAIKWNEAQHGRIENCTFENNFFAIYLAQAAHVTVANNVIRASFEKESSAGNGIHLWYCKNITIENNRIYGHRDGIYFEFVEESIVRANHSEGNLRYGLHFMFSDRCQYTDNTFLKNDAGVAVMYTENVEMRNNLFEHNWGSAAYGLLLKDITDSVIENNIFRRNSRGIYSEASNRLSVRGNTFEQNGWAIKIMANSMDNHFEKNNFIANTFDVSTNSRQNFNTFDSNYWDTYKGYDLDHDGTGDVAHRPVSLFSYLVEQNAPMLVLMRSFFVDLLNVAESIMPALTPETLLDKSPVMRRIQ